MKHIITIHSILCGLLSGAIIASEGSTQSTKAIVTHGDTFTMKKYDLSTPITALIHEPTMSQSSGKPHNSSPIDIEARPKRAFSKNRQFISSQSISSSSSSSLSSRSINEYVPIIDDCMVVNNFYVESNGKHCLIDDNGKIDDDRHMQDATSFTQYFKAKLINKNNTFFIQIVGLIGSSRSYSPEKPENNIETQVTDAQIKKLREFLQNKNALFTHDKWQNLYTIDSIEITTNNGNSTT